MGIKVCSDCGLSKPWFLEKVINKTKVYRDDKKQRWVHARCPECYSIYRKKLVAESVARRTGRFAELYK
jgi:hypothetical protein